MGLLEKLHLGKRDAGGLESTDPEERAAAADALGASGDVSAADVLLAAFEGEPERIVRLHIERALLTLSLEMNERMLTALREGHTREGLSQSEAREAAQRVKAAAERVSEEIAAEAQETAKADAEPTEADAEPTEADAEPTEADAAPAPERPQEAPPESLGRATDVSMDAWAVAIGTARGMMAALAKGVAMKAAFDVFQSERGLENPAVAADAALTVAFDSANRSILMSMGTAIGVSTTGDNATLDLGERFDTVQKAAFDAAEKSMMAAAEEVGPDPLAALAGTSTNVLDGESKSLDLLWMLVSAQTGSAVAGLGAESDEHANDAALKAVAQAIPVAFDAAEASLRQ